MNYKLFGGISSPSVIHFTALLFNYRKEYFDLKKGDHYYYDGLNNSGAVIKIDNIYLII